MLKSREWCTKERVPLDGKGGGMLKHLKLGRVRLGGEIADERPGAFLGNRYYQVTGEVRECDLEWQET